MSSTQTVTDQQARRPPRRPPTSTDQRKKLSDAQRAYVATDPRWPEHRRKLAEAQEARRFTLMENEVALIIKLRRKGRTFSYISESPSGDFVKDYRVF